MTLVWPEKTTHGCGSTAAAFPGAGEWRPPRKRDHTLVEQIRAELATTELPGVKRIKEYESLSGQPDWGRHCWYCGSLHPEDLYELLTGPTQVKLGGADWKYGWPHKFYVDLANPDQREWLCSSRSGGPCVVCLAEIYACEPYTRGGPPTPDEWPTPDPLCNWCEGKGFNPAYIPKGEPGVFHTYPTLRLKFYNEHLEELATETLYALADEIHRHTAIRFNLRDGKLHYSAPYRGYQA